MSKITHTYQKTKESKSIHIRKVFHKFINKASIFQKLSKEKLSHLIINVFVFFNEKQTFLVYYLKLCCTPLKKIVNTCNENGI